MERHAKAAEGQVKGRAVTKGDDYYDGRLGDLTPEAKAALFARCKARGLWADTGIFCGNHWLTLQRMKQGELN